MPDITKAVITLAEDRILVETIYHNAERLYACNPDTDCMFDGIAATLAYLRANGVDLSPALYPAAT